MKKIALIILGLACAAARPAITLEAVDGETAASRIESAHVPMPKSTLRLCVHGAKMAAN
jgi:hypothetical protein